MRVLQLARLWKTIPPLKYGGAELIISLLTEELKRRNHDITLIASGGSLTSGKLIEVIPEPLYEMLGRFDFESVPFAEILAISKAMELAAAGQIDLIHNHLEYSAALLLKRAQVPVITTLHSSMEPDCKPLALEAREEKYISISQAQRRLAPYLNYYDNIYHGIDTIKFKFESKPGEYMAYLATMRNEKGADRAITIALETGIPLIMAGDIRDQDDFHKLEPYIDGQNISYIGEVDFKQKNKLLSGALAYLFPIRWNEAFGLTVIESLACGTPVVAWPNGSMPELLDDGRTGFLVDSIEQAVNAVRNIREISRQDCRRSAEQKFNVTRMCDDYLNVYERLCK